MPSEATLREADPSGCKGSGRDPNRLALFSDAVLYSQHVVATLCLIATANTTEGP